MRLFHCAAGLVLTSALAFGQTSSITTFAGNQSLGPGFSGNGALATAAQLNNPDGVAVDGSGNVYISDFNNAVVRVVTPDGNINPFAGTGIVGTNGNGGLAINAQLAGPMGLAADSNGNVYIADAPNNRIQKVSISSGVVTTFAGGTAGFAGDGGAATSAALNFPTAVAVDASGNVYIADTANHRIREVSGGIISTIAGSGTFGFGGDGGAAISALLYLPKGVAVDSHGYVYISDTGNQRIRKITGTTITTIAGNGTAGYSGDKSAAINALVSSPLGLTVDPSGNVYIADTGNNVVRRIAVSGVISTVAGNGVAGYGGDGGISTTAELNAPSAVGVDLTGGYTYIADSNNNVVRLIATPFATTYIPHFAAGGNYVTAFYVINKGTQAGTFTLSFNDDTGNPVSVPVTGQSAGSSFTATVAAGGVGYYEVGNMTSVPGVSGSIVITSNTFILVQAIIRHLSSSGVYYEAADATTTGNFEIKTAFDATTFTPTGQQIYTGFAVVNTDQVNQAILTCTATDSNGNAIANAFPSLTLPPQGHAAQYNFPALLGNRGTVDCSSTTRVGVLTLRFIGNDALSTLPIIPIR